MKFLVGKLHDKGLEIVIAAVHVVSVVEADDFKKVLVHTTNGEVWELDGSIEEFKKALIEDLPEEE